MIYNSTPTYLIKAAVDKGDGIMIALAVPPDAAKALALKGGQPASDLHITLVYLGKRDEFAPGKMQTLHDIVADIARTTEPVEIELREYGVFPETDDGPCLHIKVSTTQSLLDLREKVVEAVSSYGMPPKGKGATKYVPHITLAYRESEAPPETPPIPEFRAEWLRATFGNTEAMMKMSGAVTKGEFEESEHPRADDGKFTSGGVGVSGKLIEGNNEIEIEAPAGHEFIATETQTYPYPYGKDQPYKNKREAMAAAKRDIARGLRRRGDEAPKPPKWSKSKNPDNEFGYSIEHGGKKYEVYFDRQSASWRALELLNAHGPGGAPVDHVGFNKDEVMARIKDGRYDAMVARFAPSIGKPKPPQRQMGESREAYEARLQENAMKKDAGAVEVASVNPIDVGAPGSYTPKKPKTINPYESLLQAIEPVRRGQLMKILKEWNEADHPRASDGRFGSQAGQHDAKKPEDEEEKPEGGSGPIGGPAQDKPTPENIQDVKEWGELPKRYQDRAHRMFVEDFGLRNPGAGADPKAEGQNLWNAMGPNQRLAWAQENGLAVADAPKVGDTLPGGGKIQPGDLDEPAAPGLPSNQLGQEPRVGHPQGGPSEGQKFDGREVLNYKDFNRMPEKWRDYAKEHFVEDWKSWAQKHGGPEWQGQGDAALDVEARHRWDKIDDVGRLNYAKDQVPLEKYPVLDKRDFNVSDARFWGDKPSAPDIINDKNLAWGDLNAEQQAGGKKFFVGDWINNHDSNIPEQEARERAEMDWDQQPDAEKVMWARGKAQAEAQRAARGDVNPEAPEPGEQEEPAQPSGAARQTDPRFWEGKPEGLTPKIPTGPIPPEGGEGPIGRAPEEEEEPTPDPTEEDPEPSHFTAQEWGELGGDKQQEVFDKWKNNVRDEWINGEVDNWLENFDERGGPGDDVREEMGNDEEWGHEELKNTHVYPGEEVTNQEAAAQVWAKKVGFSMERAINSGAFSWDEDGDLTVDPDLIGFTANPYEGPEAEAQQMIPGVERSELAKAWNKRTWDEVSDDVEKSFKEEYQKELERRMDKAKENPPDWIAEQADEQLEEFWDQKDDREKFREANRLLSNVHITNPDFQGTRGGDSEEHETPRGPKGTIAPTEQDHREQKAIQAKFPKGSTKHSNPNIESQGYLGGGISDTFRIRMKDGAEYAWKPVNGEQGIRSTGRIAIHSGRQYANEAAAYDIAKIGGMQDVVPVTSIVEHDGQFGAMMRFVDNSDNDGRGNGNADELAQRATVFDLIIGNTDRHGKNWVTGPNGKRWLIDNSLSFSESKSEYGRWGLFDKANIDSSDIVDEKYLTPWRGKWDQIEEVLKRRGMNEKQIKNTKYRYDHAMAGGTWGDLMGGMEG